MAEKLIGRHIENDAKKPETRKKLRFYNYYNLMGYFSARTRILHQKKYSFEYTYLSRFTSEYNGSQSSTIEDTRKLSKWIENLYKSILYKLKLCTANII